MTSSGDGRGRGRGDGNGRGRGRGRGTTGSNGKNSNSKSTAKTRCVVTTASTRRRLSLKKFNDVKREIDASLILSKAVLREARQVHL